MGSPSRTTKKSLEAGAAEAGITLKYSEFDTYTVLKVALDSGRIVAFSVDFAILNGYMEDSAYSSRAVRSPGHGSAVRGEHSVA